MQQQKQEINNKCNTRSNLKGESKANRRSKMKIERK